MKLDYSLTTPEERNEFVKTLIETDNSELTPVQLTTLADYILLDEKKKSDNKMVTVNKRETSFEGLVMKFENGEDGVYNLIANDKNIIFSPKISITEEDEKDIPHLLELRKGIAQLEARLPHTVGYDLYKLKKQIIELRKDQYVMKNNFRKPIRFTKTIKSISTVDLSENVTIGKDGIPTSDAFISLFEPKHVHALLKDYSRIKEELWFNFNSDARWIMMDLENIIEKHIEKQYPIHYAIIVMRIDGLSSEQIIKQLKDEFGTTYSPQYLSTLWCKKIPKLIAEAAIDDFLDWHYTYKEKGTWKRCSRCGQIKLAHSRYFSKNNTAKSGFYSICKDCRKKTKGE